MRVLVWAGMLLLLSVVGSVTGLAGMIGMPIGADLLAALLALGAIVGVMGVALVVVPEPRPAPARMV
jgi:hypothetical protein